MVRYQQSQKALGSEAIITLVLPDDVEEEPIFELLWNIISNFEARFSRFRESSELSMFNARAGSVTTVSKEFYALLRTCIDMSQATSGLFNPFILPALNSAGYVGSWPNVDTYAENLDYSARKVVGISELYLTEVGVMIPPDSALDFGGIGKGYLLDLLAKELDKRVIDNYWLSLGGDILCRGRNIDSEPWSVGIQSAANNNNIVHTIVNNDGKLLAMATSGTIKRRGVHNQRAWHHLINPRTGLPAETDILTATITAKSAVEADVFAKAVLIAGSANIDSLSINFDARLYIQKQTGELIVHNFREVIT